MVVTNESIAETTAYRESVDLLNDSWTGVKNNLAANVIPALVTVLDVVGKAIGPFSDEERVLILLNQALDKHVISAEAYIAMQEKMKAGTLDLVFAEDLLKGAIDNVTTSLWGTIDPLTGAHLGLWELNDAASAASGAINDVNESAEGVASAFDMAGEALRGAGVDADLMQQAMDELNLKMAMSRKRSYCFEMA